MSNERTKLDKYIICLYLLAAPCFLFAGCAHELSHEQIRLWGDNLSPESLIETLKSKDWRIRQEAAVNLGGIGDPKAVKPLIATLKDDDWRVQLAAVKALGQIGDTKASEPLEGLLKNSSSLRIRDAVKKALEKIKER